MHRRHDQTHRFGPRNSAAGIVSLLCLILFTPGVDAATHRTVAMLQHYVELDGNLVGPVRSVSGGFLLGTVATSQGTDKFIAQAAPTPVVVEYAGRMHAAWYDWIAQSVTSQQPPPRELTIVRVDGSGRIVDRLAIHDARVTRLELPALDARSQGAESVFRATIRGISSQLQGGSGKPNWQSNKVLSAMPMTNLFRLDIDGLNTQGVVSLQAMSVVLPQAQQTIEGVRLSRRNSALPQVSNLTILVPDHLAGPFYQWYVTMLVQGNTSASAERQGLLAYLTPDRANQIGTVELSGLGILRFERVTLDGQPFVEVELYCEQMGLNLGGMAM